MDGTFLYSYERMREEAEELLLRYPEKLRMRVIGMTADKRELIEVLLGYPEAPFHFLIHGAMHGREYLNSAVLMGQTAGYAEEGFPEEFCFHILPMVNPDGVTICQEGPSGIRSGEMKEFLEQCFLKERGRQREKGAAGCENGQRERADFFRRWKANGLGVDLNRNFPSGWEEYQGEPGPCAKGYKGAYPFSEAETGAICRLLGEYSFAGSAAYHSSGNLIYWHFGSSGETLEADRRLAAAIAGETGYPMRATVQEHTERAGCSDYLTLECKIPSVTIETGGGECPLPASEFPGILRRNRHVWTAMADVLAGR